MTTRTTDLDVPAAPDGIADVLRFAAEKMREQAAELAAAWQPSLQVAGKPWLRIAEVLDAAAVRCEQICNQEGVTR